MSLSLSFFFFQLIASILPRGSWLCLHCNKKVGCLHRRGMDRDRPAKKHRAECPRPTTPTHRIMDDPPTCPANRRKPSRSQSVSTNSTEQCQPHELIFFDDEEDLSVMAAEQQRRSLQCDEKQEFSSSRGCGSSSDGFAEPEANFPTPRDWFAYPHQCAPSHDAAGHRLCTPAGVPPSSCASAWPPTATLQSDDALQWQTNTAQFFRQIDERALRLAP